ncbi:MAG: tryptophan synthase subunit alpha [Bacteroidaceae bacterium]
MNRINQLFQNKKSGILSLYFCAGYPNLDSTTETLYALQQGGIDMVEIGIPFSDPMADGPIIQTAANKALKNGISLRVLFKQLHDIRKTVQMPLILMGYLNVIYQYGFENFCRSCRECGIDGAIIPDLPFDVYQKDYKEIANRYDLKIIMLITPETSEERIRLIDKQTDAFIYEVSTDATTGAQNEFDAATVDYFKRIRNMKLKNPTLVGFGISNKATLSAAQTYAAGAIIGSKFVKLTATMPTPQEALQKLYEALEK